jgi:hypothetical protein
MKSVEEKVNKKSALKKNSNSSNYSYHFYIPINCVAPFSVVEKRAGMALINKCRNNISKLN